MSSSNPIVYELREAHPEVMCRIANSLNNVLNSDYQHPRNFSEMQTKQNYAQAVQELLKCAKKEVLYQSNVIRRPEVGKVFTESSDDVMTKSIYNGIVPGLLDGKEVVPMYKGLPQETLLVDRAQIGRKDQFYSFLQGDAVGRAADVIASKLPEYGMAGVLKAGLTHEVDGAAVGSFAEKLAEREIAVVKVQPSGFWDETSAALKNLGVDLYKPGSTDW
ncbi:MAG: hypothetical protein NT016_02960 [Candidatus Aenigmarchaeota archaeon]|nr:hypothetical protein [Candidatus Aenigmarchaeota archaeon]